MSSGSRLHQHFLVWFRKPRSKRKPIFDFLMLFFSLDTLFCIATGLGLGNEAEHSYGDRASLWRVDMSGLHRPLDLGETFPEHWRAD